MQIQVQVKAIKPIEKVTDKFKKRDLIVVDNSNAAYPQTLLFQITQDKCEKADSLNPGDTITAHINLRGREYKDKNGKEGVFNTIECWRWE